MSQAECIKILEKEKRWMTVKEIKKITGVGSSGINLYRLYKNGDVKRRIKDINEFEYKII